MGNVGQMINLEAVSIRRIIGDMILRDVKVGCVHSLDWKDNGKPAVFLIVLGTANLRIILPDILKNLKEFNKRAKKGEFELCSCGLDDSPALMLEWLASCKKDYFIGGVRIGDSVTGFMGFIGKRCCEAIAPVLRGNGHPLEGI